MTPIVSDPIVAPPLAAAQTIDAVKVYGRGQTTVWGLDGVSVALGSHQFTAIMGPSGSGNSTLMHCVAGLDRLTSGRVLIGDTDLSTLADKALTLLRRDRIALGKARHDRSGRSEQGTATTWQWADSASWSNPGWSPASSGPNGAGLRCRPRRDGRPTSGAGRTLFATPKRRREEANDQGKTSY